MPSNTGTVQFCAGSKLDIRSSSGRLGIFIGQGFDSAAGTVLSAYRAFRGVRKTDCVTAVMD